MKRKLHDEQPEPLYEIRLANERVKKARRDAMTLGRLALTYNASSELTALYTIIEDARQAATKDTINAIFAAGQEFCATHAQEVLDNLR